MSDCLPNAMHSIGQSIKSPLCPCVLHFLSYLPSTFPSPFLSPSPFPHPFSFPCPFLFFPSPFPFLFSFPYLFPFSFPFLFPLPFPFPFSFPFPLSFPLSISFPLSFNFHLFSPSPFFFSLSTFLPPPLYSFSFPSSVFFPCPRPCVQYLKRHISVTV